MLTENAPNPGIHCGAQFGYFGLPPNENSVSEIKKLMNYAPYGNLTTRETKVDKCLRNT